MAAELEKSPPAISSGTSPEAAKAMREWHRKYMNAGKAGAIKPMFSNKEDLIAWVKEGNKPTAREKGTPGKEVEKKGKVVTIPEVPTKITWEKALPEGGTFTFVEYKFAADLEREKEAAEKAKTQKVRLLLEPKKGKVDAFKWVGLAVSDDETRPGLRFVAISPAGDCFASDGCRAHRANGVFPPAEGWRGVDTKGWEIEYDSKEYESVDAFIRAESALARSLAKADSLFTSEVAGTETPRLDCTFSEGFLEKIKAMHKVAKKEHPRDTIALHLDGGRAQILSLTDFQWGGLDFPATKDEPDTASLSIPYILEACAGFAKVKWPLRKEVVEFSEFDKKPYKTIHEGPALFKNVHGEALVMPTRRR